MSMEQEQEVNEVEQQFEPEVEVEEGDTTPEYSEVEQRAMESGWLPKDQWNGPEEDWVTAAEYHRRGRLFGKINSQRGEIEELRNAMRQMHNMLVKNTENGFQNAIESLRQERQQALSEGDTDRVMQLDSQLEATQEYRNKSTKELKEGVKFNQTPDFYREWKEDNAWYGSNKRMTAYADAVAREILEQNPGMDKMALLQEVSKETRMQFKQNQGTKKSNSPQVLGTQAAARDGNSNARGKGISSLRPDEQAIARTIMQATGITEKEYMKQYGGVQ